MSVINRFCEGKLCLLSGLSAGLDRRDVIWPDLNQTKHIPKGIT